MSPDTSDSSTPDADDARGEVEAWLDENWDDRLTVRVWWSMLARAGLSYPMLAAPYGRGYTRAQANEVVAALRAKGAMGAPSGIGTMLALPTVLAHGTPEQVARFVPRLIDGSDAWCQLFSEPNAGSDLAGLQTRAKRDGDEWVVTGQKVWTSTAQIADYGILLARTDPTAPKHLGLTYFLFPMHQPGVDVRPLREMTGRAVFNEVFLDGARVSDSLRLGHMGAGWVVANTTLSHERAGIGSGPSGLSRAAPGTVAGHLDRACADFLKGPSHQASQNYVSPNLVKRMIELARARGLLDDANVRQAIADLHSRMQIMIWSAQRAKNAAGRTGVEGSMAKVAMTQALLRCRELGCRILGADAQLWGRDAATDGWLQELVVFSPAPSIYGGTDEIQRNIIGERGLGLSKEPGHPSQTPFKDLPANATR